MSSGDQQPLHDKDMSPNSVPATDLPPRRTKTCSGYSCTKAVVVLYALFFLVIGAVVLAVAVWVQSIKADYESINDLVTSPLILALVAAIFMVLMAFFGIIGALREHLVLLKLFLAAIIIVFIIQVIVGILAFVYRERTQKSGAAQMQFALKSYHTNEQVQHAFDYIQKKYDCCGLKSPNDWDQNENFTCSGLHTYSCSVPDTCCKNPTQGCGKGVRSSASRTQQLDNLGIHTNGCLWYFLVWVEQHLDAVGATTLGLAIPQILGIFLVFIFIQKVEDRIFLFKYRKRVYED